MNGGNIPLPGLRCPVCGETWTVNDCADTVVRYRSEVVPLNYYIGESLATVKAAIASKTDAIYRMQEDIRIQNDVWIDMSPAYPNPTSDWQVGIVKNQHGWYGSKHGIDDQYIIRKGDQGFFNVWSYFHSKCNRIRLEQEQEAQFRTLFEGAEFYQARYHAVPNEYCRCDHCSP
jgi:hypothetical protein